MSIIIQRVPQGLHLIEPEEAVKIGKLVCGADDALWGMGLVEAYRAEFDGLPHISGMLDSWHMGCIVSMAFRAGMIHQIRSERRGVK